MKRLTGLVLFALLTLPLVAQTAESPPRYQWTAIPCAKWSCALAALAEADGNLFVLVLPTKSSEHPWVVLKRVEAGSIEGPLDETFSVECFGGMIEASSRYSAIDHVRVPMMVTTVDGGMLVVSLSDVNVTRRRSVGH